MKPEARPDEQRLPLSELQERVKELRCLYAVSQIIVEPDIARPERIRRIVTELPRAWRFPDRAVARITLDGERFESPGYERALTVQRADLVVEGVRRGSVEVAYTSPSQGTGKIRFSMRKPICSITSPDKSRCSSLDKRVQHDEPCSKNSCVTPIDWRRSDSLPPASRTR